MGLASISGLLLTLPAVLTKHKMRPQVCAGLVSSAGARLAMVWPSVWVWQCTGKVNGRGSVYPVKRQRCCAAGLSAWLRQANCSSPSRHSRLSPCCCCVCGPARPGRRPAWLRCATAPGLRWFARQAPSRRSAKRVSCCCAALIGWLLRRQTSSASKLRVFSVGSGMVRCQSAKRLITPSRPL